MGFLSVTLGGKLKGSGRFTLRHAEVLGVERLSTEYFLARLRLVEKLPEKPIPTQFIMIWIPRIDYIPMSIAWFNKDEVHVLFSVRGDGTKALSNHSGFLGILGPLGRGLTPEVLGKRCLMIAGGTGIASLIMLASELRKVGSQVDIIWGVKNSKGIGHVPQYIKSLTESDLTICTEDCSQGLCGSVIDCFNEIDLSFYDCVISSGPNLMLLKVGERCLNSGIDPYLVAEAKVECGIGICGSCLLGKEGLRLCVEGPAFKASEIINFLRGVQY